MNHLAAAELHIRIARETDHARKAMAELARATPSDRKRRGARSERLTGNAWRRAKRHLKRAAQARAMLTQLQGGTL